MENQKPEKMLNSADSGSSSNTPPPDQNSSPEDSKSPPTDSAAAPQKSEPPTEEQKSPPPDSSNATPPPGSSSSPSPPASSPPAGSTDSPPPSPPSDSKSSPPAPAERSTPPASAPPENSGGTSKPPPASHPPPPQGSSDSPVPPPPKPNSAAAQPPPASPPLTSSPNSPVISPPPNSPDASKQTPPPPAAENSGSPPAQSTSPPSAESPPKAVPSPQTPGSPPATSTQNPTPSNVPPSTSTTPASQTSKHTPKLSPPSSQSPSTSSISSQTGAIIGISVAGVVIIAFLFFCVARRRRNKREDAYIAQYKPPFSNFSGQPGGASGQADTYYGGKPMTSPPALGNSYGSNKGYSPRNPDANVMGAKSSFSYEELMEITHGFSQNNIIGEGGFGCVHKGTLPDGRVVAVKQLKAGSGQGEREFQAEVEIISRVHHRHLVSLVGYCIAERHRLLVYEFVSNNNLEHHLHGKGVPVMEWPKRLKIALGAARGLAYLHEDCHPKIIHRDIKSSNILLDDVFEAQVADFGLAKLTNDTNTHVSTRVMGTFGYMAPEYASSGKLTDRSDVYSFGVVLLELVTGRKPVDSTQPLGDESLVEWARPLLNRALDSGDFEEIVDPRLEKRYVESEMFRMIETAAACVRHSAQKRPRMVQVVRALDTEGEMGDLSNGVKYGQSTVFDSNQYSADIQRFRRMAFGNGDSSEYSVYSGEYNSREVPFKSQSSWSRGASSEFSSGSKLMP
ncbi:proline-rich receptor-like protein kinase PERK13 isoform X2 [Macadamia integrifolia]|uniref:proline-rich receptor-like protein kinase PERK13 isoform X2 n=1 Tax=Macadamia integrifolia TaxID=60698 RepID=UPI001C50021C|nr:proline-rich receptor-like protein kinase PERK13 isoform X2 [Macadamia integrifolia]